ncbi:hypothetical protein L208DRAFT_1404923, partial [Tricholoma matsutake]
YEEQLMDGAGWAPELPPDPSTDSCQMDINALSQEMLSMQVLQSAAANHEVEQQE